ncbi:hypothetical protein ABEY61_20085 [Bacillus toyonensis]|uniref:hypothetical protein n=1 Tax=Bacillus toyonensis TaxID=155322 RepID=UPI003D1C5DB1
MKIKKIGVTLLSTALLLPLAAPINSHAQENTATIKNTQIKTNNKNQYYKTVTGMGSQYTDSQSKEIIASVPIMNKYIKPNGKNQLELDPKAKEEVSEFVYRHYQRGLQAINKSAQEGYSTINMEGIRMKSKPLAQNPSSIDSIQYSSIDKYWWGVKWYMSKSESQEWQNTFADGAFYWGSVAAITGLLIPYFPPSAIASAASVLLSVGNYYCYQQLRDHTSSRGSVMTISWLDKEVYANKR